jgi:N-acetylglutamate synthase-like GNAT family acetyltransferase/nitroimidazol reductase NimA-like FMN-containing flavoprotein (pyridoxamine 5'-phosphate oxidase superfamily)
MSREKSLALLKRAKVVQLATTTPEGTPVLRSLHPIVVEGWLVFHGSAIGEKTKAIGREAVFGAEEIIAEIPSYFFDEQRACPATTFYESVQLRGVLEKVESIEEKAVYLEALMQKYQSEGGYTTITADSPLYTKVLKSILLVRVSLEQLTGKSKLGQNHGLPKRIRTMKQLWKRGQRGDVEALCKLLQEIPELPPLDFLQSPAGTKLVPSLSSPLDLSTAALMLKDAYWNQGLTEENIVSALRQSTAIMSIKDEESGTLLGVARAISDGSKHAWVYDVIIAEEWRGRGFGTALLRGLLDHPAIRNTKRVHLATKDAMGFYETFGFCEVQNDDSRPWRFETTTMTLAREM